MRPYKSKFTEAEAESEEWPLEEFPFKTEKFINGKRNTYNGYRYFKTKEEARKFSDENSSPRNGIEIFVTDRKNPLGPFRKTSST